MPVPFKLALSSENCGSAVASAVLRSATAKSTGAGSSGLIPRLSAIGHFVRRLATQLRFGKLSRAPLKLLRLELRGNVAECDWMARPPDKWDADLPQLVREQNASLQALEDAIAVRELLLGVLPDVDSAEFRVYRQSAGDAPELIITGTITRQEPPCPGVPSLAMRSKLCGLQFQLSEGILAPLPADTRALHHL
jgi:hypothetical protein